MPSFRATRDLLPLDLECSTSFIVEEGLLKLLPLLKKDMMLGSYDDDAIVDVLLPSHFRIVTCCHCQISNFTFSSMVEQEYQHSREPWNVNCVHVTAASDAAADDA